MESHFGGNRQQTGGRPIARCGVQCVQAAIAISMMKMRLHADERRLLGFQCTERETGAGSITSTIDLERYIAARMQENRDGWCKATPVSMRDCKASYGGGGRSSRRCNQCAREAAELPIEVVEAANSSKCIQST